MEQKTGQSSLVITTEEESSLLMADHQQTSTLSEVDVLVPQGVETNVDEQRQEKQDTTIPNNENVELVKEDKKSSRKKKNVLAEADHKDDDTSETINQEAPDLQLSTFLDSVIQDTTLPSDFLDSSLKQKEIVKTSSTVDFTQSADTGSTSSVCSPTEMHSPDMKSIEIKVIIQKEVSVLIEEEPSETSEAGSKSTVTTTMMLHAEPDLKKTNDLDNISDVQVFFCY